MRSRVRPGLPGARESCSSSAATSSGRPASTSPGSWTARCRAARTFLVVDGGMHHQLAASGNFGQVIRRNYPIAVGNRMGQEASRDGPGGRLPVHPAGPARRQGRACRPARSATWSSFSRPAPTGSPPAPPRSSAIRRRWRCWCDRPTKGNDVTRHSDRRRPSLRRSSRGARVPNRCADVHP